MDLDALRRGLLQKIHNTAQTFKANTLDKTDLDERVVSGVQNVTRNFTQPRQNVTSQNYKPMFQSRLQNIKPVNYGQTAQKVQSSFMQNYNNPQMMRTDPLKPVRPQIVEFGQSMLNAIPDTNKIFEARNSNPLLKGLMPDNPLSRLSTDMLLETPRSVGRLLAGSDRQLDQRSVWDRLDAIGLMPMGSVATKGTSSIAKHADYLKQVADPQTIDQIMDFVIDVQKTGGKKNYGEAGQTIHAIAVDVFGEKVRNLSNTQLANLFDSTIKEIGKKRNVFGLGLATDDVREGSEALQKGKIRLQQQPSPQSLQQGEQLGQAVNEVRMATDPSGKIIPQDKKYAFNINKPKLGLKGKDAEKLDNVVAQMKPLLERRKGKPLTDKEIIKEGRKARVLDQVMSRDESAKFAASLQATRNFIRTASKQKGVTPEYLAQLDILSSNAADAGRKLRAFGVDAEDATIKEAVLQDLQKLGIKTKQLVEASKNVDWDNASDVTEFYRKFKKAGITEILEEFRYTNMLSSPNTHIVNIFSNFLQGGLVAPIEKETAAVIDFAANRLTGRERQYFSGQGVDYAKGYWKSLPKAWDKFKKVTSGEGGLMKPDINFIPTSTSKLHKIYTTPLRVLEASDQFFRTMVEGGELASLQRTGLSETEMAKQASDTATYRLFRQQFDPDGKLGQGGVLKLWDKWNSGINHLRRLPGGTWIVPFLQTPTNILKQGVEYSPLGLATVPGSREPIVQLAKTAIGTTVFTTAYALAESGLTTWDAPTGRAEKDAYYAAGIQPYSIKIGDEWVSYSKLGPLSYPIAMAAAMKWAEDNGADGNVLATAGMGVGGFLQFFADQSYMRGIGDIIDAARGDEYKQGRAMTNIPGQLVPYRSLQGWITRLIDPVYRKTSGGTIPEQMIKSIFSQTPGLSQNLEPYTTPTGEESMRSHPLFNSFSPVRISHENKGFADMFIKTSSQAKATREENRIVKELKEAQEGSAIINDKYIWINEDGEKESLDLGKYNKKTSGLESALVETERYIDAKKAYNSELTEDQKLDVYEKLKVKPKDVEYYNLASQDNRIKSIVVREEVQNLMATSPDRQVMLQKLVEMRKEIRGKMVLASGVIDDLVDEGLISKAEGKQLKAIKLNEEGTALAKVSGRGGGAKLKKIKFVKPKYVEGKVRASSGSVLNQASAGIANFTQPQISTPNMQVPNIRVGTPSKPVFNVKFNL